MLSNNNDRPIKYTDVMDFKTLCDFFELVKFTKGPAQKSNEIRNFMTTLRREHDQTEVFNIMRLLVPGLDRDRPAYRIKESKISKLVVKMLGLPSGNDKNVLLKAHLAEGGEFGTVIYSIIKKYMESQSNKLNVLEVNQYLDQIADRTSDKGLDDLVLEIFGKLAPSGIKWFIQLILRDLKLGVGDNSILNCFHKDGASYYAMNNNLNKVCQVLYNPDTKLHELDINVFEPFRPMLSKRCDSSNFKKCFPDGKLFYVETKFDGERFQLHMQNDKFMYFSRNGFNYTDHYGTSYSDGIFTPNLLGAFHAEIRELILDGEMMLWNRQTQSYGSKGLNLDVKKLKIGKYQACFCVYDILLKNGQILTNLPLRERFKLLKMAVNPAKGTIAISNVAEVRSQQQIIDFLNQTVDNNEEGIVVKDPDSIYKYSDRNSGWFKVKMEYFDDLVHDLDVLIMGASYGSYKKLNSFLVGIVSGMNNFISLGRISSGLNSEQLDLLNEQFQKHGRDYKFFATKTEGKLQFGRDTPDMYIEPQNSFILTIRASELIQSRDDSVKTPYTLRFPRILRIRDDKPASECLNINELLDLTQQNKHVIKLNKRHIELNEITPKSRPHKKAKLDVISLETPQLSNILENRKIYVHAGDEDWAKDDIYNAVKRAGGKMAFRLDPDVDIILAPNAGPFVENLMKRPHRFDIVLTKWLKRILHENELSGYNQGEIISVGWNFSGDLCRNLDRYGNSYIEETTPETLERTFALMQKKQINFNSNCFKLTKSANFEHFKAYFDQFEIVNDRGSKKIYSSIVDEMHFRHYKGHVLGQLTAETNLIVMSKDDDTRKYTLVQYLGGIEPQLENKVTIVARNFLYDRTKEAFTLPLLKF